MSRRRKGKESGNRREERRIFFFAFSWGAGEIVLPYPCKTHVSYTDGALVAREAPRQRFQQIVLEPPGPSPNVYRKVAFSWCFPCNMAARACEPVLSP